MNIQKPIHTNPSAPIMTNEASQPYAAAINGMVSGAASAPTVAPALKILVAKPRSFFGKYSAVAFIAAGKLPASPIANTIRAKINKVTLTDTTWAISPTVAICSLASSNPTNQLPVKMPDVAIPQYAWIHAPTDQIPIAHKKPRFVSIQSINLPANSMEPAYTMENIAVIFP